MNILVRLILYRMKKQCNFENAEMLSHISDHNDIGMSGKNFGPLKWYTDRNFFGDEGGGGATPLPKTMALISVSQYIIIMDLIT